jgi:hypothetical protein
MSFDAHVFRVLIASPSDVIEERDIAVQTIQDWNDLNSAERQIVLLPLRWETHSAPEYDRRPQEVINRQVVDHSDLLVGIFWTRIGSPTGRADSGTLEEIERVATNGKPVMLYFSHIKEDPNQIEIDQLQKLRDFKAKTFPKALVATYTSRVEFRDQLAKHLEIQLRTLVANEGGAAGDHSGPITDVEFAFATLAGGKVGPKLNFESTFLVIEDFDNVSDYSGGDKSDVGHDDAFKAGASTILGGSGISTNKNYYRDWLVFLQHKSFFRPVRFWLKNVGRLGARDVYADIRITSEDTELVLFSEADVKLSPPTPTIGWDFSFRGSSFRGSLGSENEAKPSQTNKEWTTHLELRALQPQREVSPPDIFYLGAMRSGLITIVARIYADTLPEPITRSLQINWEVVKTSKRAMELLKEAQLPSLPIG